MLSEQNSRMTCLHIPQGPAGVVRSLGVVGGDFYLFIYDMERDVRSDCKRDKAPMTFALRWIALRHDGCKSEDDIRTYDSFEYRGAFCTYCCS